MYASSIAIFIKWKIIIHDNIDLIPTHIELYNKSSTFLALFAIFKSENRKNLFFLKEGESVY